MISSRVAIALVTGCAVNVLHSAALAIHKEQQRRAHSVQSQDGLIAQGFSPRPVEQLRISLDGVRSKGPHGAHNFSQHGTNVSENGTAGSGSDKVEVAIYYEALCPFCRNLMHNSVVPMWNDTELRKRIDLKLYPFGNAMAIPRANVSEGYRFWHAEEGQKGIDNVFACQHGEEECFGNTIQACVIHTLKSPRQYVPFILCMETYNEEASLEMSSYDCAAKLSIDLQPIRACATGKEGNEALLSIAQATDDLQPPAGPHQYVPWVTVNGEHSQAAEMDGMYAGGHLLNQVCASLAEPKPALCSGSTRSSPLMFMAALLVASFVSALC